jgi:hypothetical protein
MKKGKKPWGHICQQLHGAACLAEYCKEVGRTFWQVRTFLEGYTRCYVSISHVLIGKGRMQFALEPSQMDRKTMIKKIDHPHHLQYAKLISAGPK